MTSQTPTLHWTLDPTCDGAHVQICRDRACTDGITAFDATGTDGAPPAALPSGVLFWRAYGRHGSTVVQGWTPTWQFTVGARSAPVDTSWGTTLDVNGDGFADVAVGAPGAGSNGQVEIFLGGPSGPAATADLTLTGSKVGDYFGLFVASAGDVNGDGYADLVVGGASGAYVYLGGPSGLAGVPAAALSPPAPAHIGIRVASAGDANGDGFADVVIANYDVGIAYLYLGSPTTLGSTPAVTFTAPPVTPPPGSPAPPGGGFGHSLAGAGDVNGDGYGDFAVGAGASDLVYVYLGGASGPSPAPSFTLADPDAPDINFGNGVSDAGDVNGDGYADLVVGADQAPGQTTGEVAGRAYVYLGSVSGPAATPAVTLTGSQPYGYFGRWVSTGGDVNGDGYADVIVGADAEYGNGDTAPGWAYLYLGGAGGLSPTPAATLTGPDGPGSWFGRCVAAAGDVNGDGYADVVIGADAGGVVVSADAGALATAGWTYVYLGHASGLADSPAVRWTGPSSNGAFGRALASAVRRRPSVSHMLHG